jgi:YidC/Oxa1 family membrane protein insertase
MDRNLVLALVLTALILVGWESLVAGPQRDAVEQRQREADIALAETAEAQGLDVTDRLDVPTVDAGLSRIEALAVAPGRVPIDTPAVVGSINLRGAAIDDLTLRNYHIEPDDSSPLVQLLSGQGPITS